MRAKLIIPLGALALVSTATTAEAYIGPGLGAGTIAAVLGLLAAILMACLSLIWYPMKRLLRKQGARHQEKEKP